MELLKRVERQNVKEELPQGFSFDRECDICVVGMGTSGAISTIVSAESGLDVIGIDRLNGLGGIGTLGGVFDYFYGNYGGEYERINKKTTELVNSLPYVDASKNHDEYAFAGQVKANVLENEALDNGAHLMYDTTVCGVFMDGRKVVGVQCISSGKIINIYAKAVIDASGDGTVAACAALPEYAARSWDNRFIHTSKPILIYRDGFMNGVWNSIGNIDARSADSFAEHIIYGYTVHPLYYATYENHKDIYAFECTILGQRQAYRIVPDDPICFEDFINQRHYEKPLFYAYSCVDTATGDTAFDNDNNVDWRFLCGMTGFGFSQPVEMAALLPKGIDGLIVTGKGAGVDCDMAGLLRMKRDLEKCGEAVAKIAVLSVKKNIEMRNVDYSDIAPLLRESGCLDEQNNYGLCRNTDRVPSGFIPVTIITDTDEIYKAFKTDNYNVALWSARIMRGDLIERKLTEWLTDDDARVRIFSATVLGMRKNKACLPVVEDVIEHHERYDKPFLHRMLCLAGRFADEKTAESIFGIMLAAEKVIHSGNSMDGKKTGMFGIGDIDSVRFSVVALYNIATRCNRKDITERLRVWCTPDSRDSVNLAYARQSLLNNLNK